MLLVSDINSFNSNERYIFDKNVSKLEEWMKKGNTFMLCSNNDATRLSKKLKVLDIPVDYISCSNGSYLFDRNWNLISKKTFNPMVFKKIKVFENNPSIKNIQYATTWNFKGNEVGLREVSSIHMEINKESVDTKFLDTWKKFRMENDYSYYLYYHDRRLFYVIKPKDSSRVNNIRYLERNTPFLKSDIYVDANGIENYLDIKDYNSFIIGDNHYSDEFFPNYLTLSDVIDSIPDEKRIVKRKK